MYVHLGIGLCLTGLSKSPKWSELAIRKRRPSAGSSPQSPSAAVFCGQNVSLFQTFWLLRPSFDWSRPSQRTLLKSVQSGLWFTPANPFTASPRLVFEWFVGGALDSPWEKPWRSCLENQYCHKVPLQTLWGRPRLRTWQHLSKHGSTPFVCASAREAGLYKVHV